MLPIITPDMQSCVLKNPIVSEVDYLLTEFEEIQTVSYMAKFCILKTKLNIDEAFIHYTVVPIKVDYKSSNVSVGDIVLTNSYQRLKEIASKCDLVALIPNGPTQINDKALTVIVNRALFMPIGSRMIIDNDHFYSFDDVMSYLGIAIIKHSYFWMSHQYCMSTHEYYKHLNVHSQMLLEILGTNVYAWSMDHECTFGYEGNALMRIFDMSSEHFDHFLSLLYSSCDGFDDNFRVSVTRLSSSYETNPFVIQMLGSNIVITKLHTHEHYLYLEHKNLIDKFKQGKVTIDATDES